jgi:hypothetical protein
MYQWYNTVKIHFHKKSQRHRSRNQEGKKNIYRRGTEFAETRVFIKVFIKNPSPLRSQRLCGAVSGCLFHKRRKACPEPIEGAAKKKII